MDKIEKLKKMFKKSIDKRWDNLDNTKFKDFRIMRIKGYELSVVVYKHWWNINTIVLKHNNKFIIEKDLNWYFIY